MENVDSLTSLSIPKHNYVFVFSKDSSCMLPKEYRGAEDSLTTVHTFVAITCDWSRFRSYKSHEHINSIFRRCFACLRVEWRTFFAALVNAQSPGAAGASCVKMSVHNAVHRSSETTFQSCRCAFRLCNKYARFSYGLWLSGEVLGQEPT